MRKSFALLAALFGLACISEASVMPAEKLLPDDTLVMFTLPDFNQVRAIFHDSPQGRFWSDPAMKDFKDKFIGKLTTDYISPMEHDLGVHFEDYTNLAQGQFTVAMIQNGWEDTEGQRAAFLLLMDAKDQSSQLRDNLADLKKKWVAAGKTLKTEQIRDVDFSVITLSTNDLPKSLRKPETNAPGAPEPFENPDKKNEPKTPIYIGQAESLLIIGDSPKVIEKLLVRMSGGSLKSLSDVSAFQANAPVFHDAPAFGWLNSKAIVDVMTRPADGAAPGDASNPFGFDMTKVVSAIGLNGLQTVAFSYLFSSEGAQFNFMLSLPEAERTGLFKILAGEAKDCSPPPFVPADAVKFQRLRIDGRKSYATLRKMLSDISPAAIGAVDLAIGTAEAAAKEKDPNFDLNKYLFENLGDDMISYQKNPKGESLAELGAPPSIFLLGSPNAAQLASAFKSVLVLYTQQAAAPMEREFLGHKIYSIPLPSPPGADGSAPARSFNYAASGGYVAMSTDNALIEEYLRSGENPPKALRDAPGFSDAAQKVSGPGTSIFGYANDHESMRVLFDVMKKDASGDQMMARLTPLTLALGLNPLKPKDWVDTTLLPAFDLVSKYFYISVYGCSANADGLTFKAFAPVPPELKK
jgi:hypothetical protein